MLIVFKRFLINTDKKILIIIIHCIQIRDVSWSIDKLINKQKREKLSNPQHWTSNRFPKDLSDQFD